jgi:hypothetical protein
MPDVIVVGLLSLGGTLIGTLGGILAANRLTNWRIEQLEKKVDKHNSLIERTFKLEGKMCEVEHDIEDMKKQRGA